MACLQTYSSTCVKYQGASFPQLGITTQLSTVTDVEELVLEKILLFLDGSGIDLSAIDYNCTSLENRLVDTDKTLVDVITALVDEVCANKTLLDEIDAIVGASVTYDTDCLTVTENTTEGVIQALITKVCALNTSVSSLTDQITGSSLATTIDNRTGNYIKTNITAPGDFGITKSGSGSSVTLEFTNGVPPFTPLWCYAPLSYWNADGSGKTDTPFENWYICNGSNGTIDMRGWTPAGATSLPGISSGSLDSTVDPDVQADPTIATSIGDKKGQVKHGLTVSEMPSHFHTMEDTEHNHKLQVSPDPIKIGTESPTTPIYGLTTVNTGFQLNTEENTVTGSTDNTGSSNKHENRQPTKYGYFIMQLI